MKIVFMGTPAFAVPTLVRLLDHRHQVLAVYTRADRRRGRGLRFDQPPVKKIARQHGLPVRQPERLRDPAEWAVVRGFAPDAIVVVAYGKILPPELLSIPSCGAINVHASLLPRHRGAAPIAWTILCGDRETGVTTMQMDAGMDTGDILLQERFELDPRVTAGDLETRLAPLGADLLIRTLQQLESGDLSPRRQREEAATRAPRIGAADARINWDATAAAIDRQVRAFFPKPGAHTRCRGLRLKVLEARPVSGEPGDPAGQLLDWSGDVGRIGCGDGTRLEVVRVQPEGKEGMSFGAFARGRRLEAGERFE